MHRILLATFALALLGVPALAAPAPKQIAYVGIHPLPDNVFCEIEGAHVHVQAPEHADLLYVQVDGRFRFVGDPAPFGYQGPKFAYHGHHPLVVGDTVHESYCYLDGPHYHHIAPPAKTFVRHGDAYWYVGTWPKRYHAEAPKRTKINVVYAPLLHVRPVIAVAPPPAFHQPVIEVVVAVPAPRVQVVPWIVVEDDHHHHKHHKHKKHHHHHKHHHH
ncbi:MAG: hypothetical protein KF773_06885 [Deltaproteobacteria bacterium]|nr:hypothetical protein [Deltaproteobacteria bacterium]